MKHRYLLASIFLIATSQAVLAADEYCTFDTFKRFKVVEKTGHTLTSQPVLGELKERVEQYEILCPRQIEADFNGDRKKDWVGLVSKAGKYSLLAYLSSQPRYKIITLAEYQFFPETLHLDQITTKELALLSGKKQVGKNAKYALVTNKIGDYSHAYAWDGQTLKHALAWTGSYQQSIGE